MGGEREFRTVGSYESGIMLNSIRIHESCGQVHFHDDDAGMKVAVKSGIMYDVWRKFRSGAIDKFKLFDFDNGTMVVLKLTKKNGKIDLNIKLKRIGGYVGTNFANFDKFINGDL